MTRKKAVTKLLIETIKEVKVRAKNMKYKKRLRKCIKKLKNWN